MSTNLDVVERILIAKRDEAREYFEKYDRPFTEIEGGWLDGEGCWKDWESEAEGSAAEAAVATFDKALAIVKDVRENGTTGAVERNSGS